MFFQNITNLYLMKACIAGKHNVLILKKKKRITLEFSNPGYKSGLKGHIGLRLMAQMQDRSISFDKQMTDKQKNHHCLLNNAKDKSQDEYTSISHYFNNVRYFI